MRIFFPLVAVVFASALTGAGALTAQSGSGSVRLRVLAEDAPVSGATVRATGIAVLTDEAGRAVLALPGGTHRIVVTAFGLAERSVDITLEAGETLELELEMEVEAEELEEVVVLSTRSERRIEETPVRVEVIGREEIEEKILMTPGDIAMLLNETSGLRVQNTSPSLGGANVRIQGLRGRYTQILSDGLPLYGGQSGALSMLQIPPMDLGQVEVIKGAASALYGASALGGVVNLISRRPQPDEREVLLNQSTLGGTDAVLWAADRSGRGWGYTFLGGVHRQGKVDVDEDGWADLAGYRRVVARPRLFWDDGAGRSIFFTMGTTLEDRRGGTVDDGRTPAGTVFEERLGTRRVDAGLLGRLLLGGDRLLTWRASAMAQRHEHGFGEADERDLHSTGFAEVAYTATTGAHTWVLGAAVQQEGYRSTDVPAFDFSHTIPSVLAQDEYAPTGWLTLSGSGRLDRHSEYGVFFNPRLSALVRPGANWTARLSAGTGYFAPTPFTEETEVVGLRRLRPFADLEPERARNASLDVGRVIGPLEVNVTAFGSLLEDAVRVRQSGDRLELRNADGPTRTWGGELLARWRREPFHLTGTYAYLRSTEAELDGPGRREVPRTPRHTAGLVGMWEQEGSGRVGIEVYYTGRQTLDENPYRSSSRPYVITGILVERRFGRARLFLNAENLLDARQTAFDPLVLPERSPVGRWTTDAWGPLEGRAINAGVRYDL